MDLRREVEGLLDAWASGERSSRDVFIDAKVLWLDGDWPKAHEPGHDPVGEDVLFILASARDVGLTDGDLPALRAFASATRWRHLAARRRFFDHLEADLEARVALRERDDLYGPRTDDGQSLEAMIPGSADRRLHRLVREDPEAAWEELAARLCTPGSRDVLFLMDAVEDLLFDHADAFIDRLEGLAETCPAAWEVLEHVHLGGHPSTAGVERFDALQARFRRA